MNEVLPPESKVLVVGAGPVGLMAACQLTLHGVPVIIIDKKTKISAYSGALFIQARTLEIFEQMGLADVMMERGQIPAWIHVLKNGRHIFKANIKEMGRGLSKFPHVLMVKQGETEKTLINFLKNRGVNVHWNMELKSIRDDGDKVRATINSNGRERTVHTTYLIGADGANSQVREILDIPVEVRSHPTPLFIIDGGASFSYRKRKKQVPFSRDTLYFSICRDQMTGFFPLPGNKWRIDGIIPPGIEKKDDFNFNLVKKEFNRGSCLAGGVDSSDWFSSFRIQTKLASSYKEGPCFLAGDAAHVHTPIGAQGMNTGIQDTYNLCWKIALVLQEKISAKALTSYEYERRPVAKKLIKSTDNLFLMVIKDKWFFKVIRRIFFPFALKLMQPVSNWPALQKKFFKAISETGIKYNIPAKQNKRKGWMPGERLPCMNFTDAFNNKKCLHDVVDGKKFVLFLFDQENIFKMSFSEDIITYKQKGILKIVNIHPFNSHLYKSFAIKRNGWYLVRPDMYIGERLLDEN